MDKSRKFITALIGSSFFIAAVTYFFANFLVAKFYAPNLPDLTIDQFRPEHSEVLMQRSWPWWIAKAYEEQKQAPDIVVMGSSQMASAVFASDAHLLQLALDCVNHRHVSTLETALSKDLASPVKVFNCSLGGNMASDAYMYSRALLTGNMKPKLVILGIAPRDFMDNTLPSAGSTEPFQFFSQYVDTRDVVNMSFPTFNSRIDWLFSRELPLRKMRLSMGLSEANQDPSSQHGNNGQFLKAVSSASGQVKLGQWVIPANMPYVFADNIPEYMKRYHNPNPPLYGVELKFFKKFLSYLHDENVRVIVVGMPCLYPVRDLLPPIFWQQYNATIGSTCNQYQAQWVDLTTESQFTPEDFLDTVHLNASGGQKLLKDVAVIIEHDQSTVACLKQNNQTTALRTDALTH